LKTRGRIIGSGLFFGSRRILNPVSIRKDEKEKVMKINGGCGA
jgi:hypothetical protein